MASADVTAPAVADLKAGHPPAVKAGGMRVVQHKKEAEKSEVATMTTEEEAEFGSSPPKTDKHHQLLVISGAITKGDRDFTPQAVRSFHVKPHPTHDAKPRPVQYSHFIQQPR